MLCQWRTVCKWNMQIACSCITWIYRTCYVFTFRVFGPGLWTQVLSGGIPVLARRYPCTGWWCIWRYHRLLPRPPPPASIEVLHGQDWSIPTTGFVAGSTPRVVSRRRTFLFTIYLFEHFFTCFGIFRKKVTGSIKSTPCFIMVICENFLVQLEFSVQQNRISSQTTILKLFQNQSELDILPLVWPSIMIGLRNGWNAQ